MRQVTLNVLTAFLSGRTLKAGNTKTDGQSVWLHGNKIIERRDDGIWITNAGWNSATTKERLNGLQGVNIRQRNGVWFLNGIPWNGDWVNVRDYEQGSQYVAETVSYEHEFDVTSEWMNAGYSRPIYFVFHTLVESEREAVEKLLRDHGIESKRMESDTDGVYRPNYFVIVHPDKHKEALDILNNQN
jgi:hypothetical protein